MIFQKIDISFKIEGIRLNGRSTDVSSKVYTKVEKWNKAITCL